MKSRLVCLIGCVAVIAGCGSGSSTPKAPTIEAARTYQLANFQPAGPVQPGKPVPISFTIQQPNGQPLTAYKRGPGPHTGVHVILVRDDLSSIIHVHPPIAADGKVAQQITLPEPGPYRVVVDAYPKSTGQPNFQLFSKVDASGSYKPKPLPSSDRAVVVDGYRFELEGKPRLKALEAGFIDVKVTDTQGRPARFTPWFGALAHAIFFRKGSLDYFHTHVCAPGASGCTSILGGSQVKGTSTTPGKLRVGVLVPVSGEWRLFLQTRANGRVLTAPFTLEVK